jgi:hypothetical protein
MIAREKEKENKNQSLTPSTPHPHPRPSQNAIDSHGQLVLVSLGGGFTTDELLPKLVSLVDDLDGVLFGLGLSGESKDVLGLSIGDLVDPEPLVCDEKCDRGSTWALP